MRQANSTDTADRMAGMEKSLAALEQRVALQARQIEELLAPAATSEPSDTLSGVELFRLRQETARQMVISAERRARKEERRAAVMS